MTDETGAAGFDVAALVERVERELIGGSRAWTRGEVAEQVGMAADDVRAMWRALGFAVVDDGERIFTDVDVEALAQVGRLRELAGLDEATLLSMTRVIGQSFARLAAWQGQMVLDIVAASPELASDPDRMLELVESITPLTEQLHGYVWRRQLAAYFARVAGDATSDWGDAEREGAVGFVDMAGFTSFTRRADKAELHGVLERFEALANETAVAHHGQVVKLIGDEVLYLADDPADAARIALAMVAAAEVDDTLPQLRAGVASGPVVRRLGDVFGATVNIASRLTSIARPDSVLVDRAMAEVLGADEAFTLKAVRPESVRGYHHLRPWRLRAAPSLPSTVT